MPANEPLATLSAAVITREPEASSPPPFNLLGGYKPLDGKYDEMLALPGSPREPWQTLVGSLEGLGSDEFALRAESARRILRDHGASYNVYGDAQGADRPWALDLMPLVISAAEWRVIEAGLEQRARLLNAILADVYGPQALVKDNWVPPGLVFPNPGFLRACYGVSAPKGTYLALHAVDLARSPNGQWRVLADRTQAPSGLGYALENRLILARLLPDEFRDCQVQRLGEFFQVERDMLRNLAPRREHPHVVVLTPGPYNETYFEHVFLARYLGFPLVEGGDLTVREEHVFIKTLEGLQPVDVILRRVDDTFCDPLELRADSFLGVPGLLQAARAGHVAVANALGSGVAEAAGLAPFLPGLCRHLLGEELKLASVPTWWCGQEKECDYVLEHLPNLVIKSAFAKLSGEPAFGHRLSQKEQENLQAAIGEAPYRYVAQEEIDLSTVPVWNGRSLEPRPLVLRTYTCASEDGFRVMPGGLTRVSAAARDLVVSIQSGGVSKDTWVLADGPVNTISLLSSPSRVVRLERAAAEVPSRVADNLFWLGRYAERLEDTVRTLRALLSRLAGESAVDEAPELGALIRLLVRLDLFPTRFMERHSLAGVERETFLLIYQVHRLGTVREVLDRLRQIAFVLRDRFSADTWQILNRLQVPPRSQSGRMLPSEALSLLNTLIVQLAAFSGMEMENMTRGHGWRFLDMGRRLERAINATTLLEGATWVHQQGFPVLEPTLEIADSLMTYRRCYFAQPQLPAVLDLLLADETNPRSLSFQLRAVGEHILNLPRAGDGSWLNGEAERLMALQEQIEQADFPILLGRPQDGEETPLKRLLGEVAAQLRSLSDALTHTCFSHTTARVS